MTGAVIASVLSMYFFAAVVPADERLADFSDMVKDIGAEARGPGKKQSETKQEKTEKTQTGTQQEKTQTGTQQEKTEKTQTGTQQEKTQTGTKQEKTEMTQSETRQDEESRLREFSIESQRVASENKVTKKPAVSADNAEERGSTSEGDRLDDFASLVKDAEESAGFSGSDPERDRVIRTGETGGGDPDGRLSAMAKETRRIEEEMEKKYGPALEDRVISNPGEYNDGDRVVATENTKAESAAGLKGIRFNNISSTRKRSGDLFELKGDELRDTMGSFKDHEEGEVSDRFEASENDDFSIDRLLNGKGESLGIFKLTAYDACIICCGKTDGITATGTKAEVGRTIAVDPNVIPFGTKVMINGHIYTAEDSGSKIKGNRIDVFLSTHEEAKRFGVKEAEVFLVE